MNVSGYDAIINDCIKRKVCPGENRLKHDRQLKNKYFLSALTLPKCFKKEQSTVEDSLCFIIKSLMVTPAAFG